MADSNYMNDKEFNPHSPANFNPGEYTVVDYLDNQPPKYYMGLSAEAYRAIRAEWEAHIKRYFINRGDIYHCHHCGNGNVRYVCVVEHVPTKANLIFGSDCVHKLEFANRDDLKLAQLKARAAQGHARLRIYAARQSFLEQHPEVKAIIDDCVLDRPEHIANTFARDLMAKLDQYGSLSSSQEHYLLKSLHDDRVRFERAAKEAAEKAALRAAGIKGPEGRTEVEGVVLHVRQQDGDWGINYKWLVRLDSGIKVWSTVPNVAFDVIPHSDHKDMVGARVKFTATWERSQNDDTFAFGKRPSKFSLLASPATPTAAPA
jgi:hypothetical protein